MLLGIVTDIHDRVNELRQALAWFEQEQVDQVVTLGDAVDTYTKGETGAEVFALLEQAGAVGVWGNHDAGLSLLWTERLRDRIDPSMKAFAATLRPFLVLGDCRFSHIEPWLDACSLKDLWYYDGPPDTVEKASRSFEAVPERFLFMGHYHRWLVMTHEDRVDWDGERPITLDGYQRCLVVVGELMRGRCATFDTKTALLTPHLCNVTRSAITTSS